jgi:hypothetical protein
MTRQTIAVEVPVNSKEPNNKDLKIKGTLHEG